MRLPEGAGRFNRLEDFIQMAEEGKSVQARVDLRKQTILQNVHPDETDDSSTETDSYLLIGDYTFRVGNEAWMISKIYVLGSVDESLYSARINRSIANERLKNDYGRLTKARISLEERYFEEAGYTLKK